MLWSLTRSEGQKALREMQNRGGFYRFINLFAQIILFPRRFANQTQDLTHETNLTLKTHPAHINCHTAVKKVLS